MTQPLADSGVQRLFAILPTARLVGGCVRDTLAGRPVADIDLATPLPPEDAAQTLTAAGIRVIPTGLAHGTVTALIDGRPYEITTLRRDLVTDGRHAEVAWTGDWREDAARRDFTMNAMSLAPDGTLHDYFGGAADLAALPPDPVLRTAALLTGDRAVFAKRLKLSLAEAGRLLALQGPPPSGDDADLRRQLADTDQGTLIGRSLLARQPEAVRDRIRAIPRPVFTLEGRDALALGLKPGPRVGALLREVRAWWLDGGCLAGPDDCRAELARRANAC